MDTATVDLVSTTMRTLVAEVVESSKTIPPVSMRTQTLGELQAGIDAGEIPSWMDDCAYATLLGGYLLEGETPRGMYMRLSTASAARLGRPDLAPKFFDLFWKNWLCPATPVAANMGTTRGLPISCFGLYVDDSINGIMSTMHEVASLAKHGGGIGVYWGAVRPRGSKIGENGQSEGVVPFLKILDSVTVGISQGSTRRGASAAYLPIEHPDFDEFLRSRKPEGDPNRQCLNIQHSVTISDDFMHRVLTGDVEARRRWLDVIKSRAETGGPYVMFSDTVDRARPDCYKGNDLDVKTSQLCSEITLHNDPDHTFVCCLSSLNVVRFDEWKNTDAVQLSVWFLEGVMSEFIERAKSIPGFERAVRFSEKSRALGLGVLGWHTYLQDRMVAMDSMEAYLTNRIIFKRIREEAELATAELAKVFGEPEWCKGYGRRHTHLLAVAPTASNSIISGNVSPGIEPTPANAYTHKTAKGTFFQKNKRLVAVLAAHGKDTIETWDSILVNSGSVAHLDFLTDDERKVFLTARELNQHVLVKLASSRQEFIDQAQSLNLFFPKNTDTAYLNEVHLQAWKTGVQTLYYCRTESVISGDAGTGESAKVSSKGTYKREVSECTMCEG